MTTEWERYYCPFCQYRGKSPDVKGKLYVNWAIKRYLCFRCGSKGRSFELDRKSLVPYRGFLGLEHGGSSSTWDPRRFVEYSLAEVRDQFPEVYRLLERKHALDRFQKVNLVFFTQGYGLVIPIDQDNFQIRLFSSLPDAPKYLTKRGFRKNGVLLGADKLVGDFAIFVEGIFDYYRLEGLSVCVFGHFISSSAVSQLLARGVRKFLVFWDDDSWEESVKAAVELYQTYLVETYAVFCLDGSPSDTSQLWDSPCLEVTSGSFMSLGEFVYKEVT